MSFTPPQDKRDLLNTFGLDRRVQIKDSFFHNANSLIRRSVWERFPFDGKASNIEDRLWARRVLNAGFSLIYEPMSQVYHHHGIHQNGRKERCQGVTRILESIFPTESPTGTDLPMESHDALAVIVLQTGAASDAVFDEDLLESTFKSIQESRFIKQIVFAVDDPALGKLGCRWNSEVIIRPAELSKFGVRADEVLSFVLKELAKQGRYPEIVVPLEITYPFRPPGLIDALVEKLVTEGLDTVIAGNPEFRPCWNNTTDGLLRVDQSQGPRSVRDPLLIGLPNLGCATRPSNLHRGTRLGGNLGIVEVPHPLCSMEIRNASDLKLYKTLRLANISLNYNEAPITSAFCAVHEKQNLQ
jgi:hypothetical protein